MSSGSMNAVEHGPSCDDADVTLWCDDCRETLRHFVEDEGDDPDWWL